MSKQRKNDYYCRAIEGVDEMRWYNYDNNLANRFEYYKNINCCHFRCAMA